MAPRQLIVRWRKDKAKRRRERPRAFSTKANSGVNTFAVKENASFQYRKRGGGNTDYMMQRLHHYIKVKNPHKRILYWLFSRAIRHASEELYPEVKDTVNPTWLKKFKTTESGFGYSTEEEDYTPTNDVHPKIAVENLFDLYAQQDPSLKVFQFEAVVLERSSHHEVIMFFRGQECFILFRKGKYVQRSRMYKDPMFLKHLSLKKVEWEEEYILDRESLADLDG